MSSNLPANSELPKYARFGIVYEKLKSDTDSGFLNSLYVIQYTKLD